MGPSQRGVGLVCGGARYLVEVDLLRSVILRVLTSLERERSPSECVVPVQFFRLCRKRPWSTVDGEVLLQNLYTIALVRPWTLRMWRLDTPRCGGFGQRLCPDLRGTVGALGSGLPAIQDDPTTQR